jgi:hypothetical protein
VTLRQRQPRLREPKYLAWLRTQRCACGCLRGPPCDAAHLRASSLTYDKPLTGIGTKPDDRWALPLLHSHHMAQHRHPGGELAWWASRNVTDPFALCHVYYERYMGENGA